MAGIRIEGNTSGNVGEVDAFNQQLVATEKNALANPTKVGAGFAYVENDAGAITGVKQIRPPEIDVDYRTRVSSDLILDEETNMGAQATGKYVYNNATMTNLFTTIGQITTNSGSIVTANTATTLASYAMFPLYSGNTLCFETEVGFSLQPQANTIVEFGLGNPGSNTAAPTDGIFLRLNSGGLQGIATYNGTETSTGLFPLANGTGTWSYVSNRRYKFIIYNSVTEAQFWVDDGTGAELLGTIPLPLSNGRLTLWTSGQYFHKHRIGGSPAPSPLQSFINSHSVRLIGAAVSTTMSTQGNRVYGSYQGFSGGSAGSLANYVNSTNPTATVPTNTTAALGTGLGGQFWETDTLAVTTDGIIQSHQLPSVNIQNAKRLVIRGVKIQSFVQTVLTGGGYVAQWSLAFGHTAVSLATTETQNSKSPRRIPLGLQDVAANAAANTVLREVFLDLGVAPIFLNPGEFVQVVKKKIGTAPTAGVIGHIVTYVYGWE